MVGLQYQLHHCHTQTNPQPIYILKNTLEGNGYTSCDSYNARAHVGTDIEMNFSYMYSTLILSFCTPDGAMYISSLYVYIISLHKQPEIIAYTR